MHLKNISLFILVLLSFLLSCQPAKESNKGENKLKVIATIFPIYDFARNIGGDKINVTMLLPPGTDAHHYELKPKDIINVGKADIFLFTNFEMATLENPLHPHFSCRNCGAFTCLAPLSFTQAPELILPKDDYSIDHIEINISGLCACCRNATNPQKSMI